MAARLRYLQTTLPAPVLRLESHPCLRMHQRIQSRNACSSAPFDRQTSTSPAHGAFPQCGNRRRGAEPSKTPREHIMNKYHERNTNVNFDIYLGIAATKALSHRPPRCVHRPYAPRISNPSSSWTITMSYWI